MRQLNNGYMPTSWLKNKKQINHTILCSTSTNVSLRVQNPKQKNEKILKHHLAIWFLCDKHKILNPLCQVKQWSKEIKGKKDSIGKWI